MFCSNCGKEIKDNSKFCRYCGESIDSTGDEINNYSEPIIENNYNYSNEHYTSLKKKKNKTPLLIGIVGIFIFVIAISVLAFSIFSNKTKQTNTTIDIDNLNTSETYITESTTVEQSTTEETSIIEEPTTEIISEEAFNPNAENLNLNIQQVDSQNFPNIVIYANIENQNNITVKGLTKDNFILFETDKNGNKLPISINKIHQVDSNDKINLSLVLDNSGSMYTDNNNGIEKMAQAKQAATNFLKQVRFDKDYKVSITCFDDFVYLIHDFSGNLTSLSNSVGQINTEIYGLTALYDAIYSSILNTYPQAGAKCIIAFTDGVENASNYTFDDVVYLSQRTGIPVYIIGIGEEPNSDSLSKLAESCSGEYFYIDTDNLSNLLEKIYLDIYNNQEELYAIEYTSPIDDNTSNKREITFTAKGSTGYNGKIQKTYIPVPSLNDDFGDYKDNDFIIDNSNIVS